MAKQFRVTREAGRVGYWLQRKRLWGWTLVSHQYAVAYECATSAEDMAKRCFRRFGVWPEIWDAQTTVISDRDRGLRRCQGATVVVGLSFILFLAAAGHLHL